MNLIFNQYKLQYTQKHSSNFIKSYSHNQKNLNKSNNIKRKPLRKKHLIQINLNIIGKINFKRQIS